MYGFLLYHLGMSLNHFSKSQKVTDFLSKLKLHFQTCPDSKVKKIHALVCSLNRTMRYFLDLSSSDEESVDSSTSTNTSSTSSSLLELEYSDNDESVIRLQRVYADDFMSAADEDSCYDGYHCSCIPTLAPPPSDILIGEEFIINFGILAASPPPPPAPLRRSRRARRKPIRFAEEYDRYYK